MDPEFRPLAFTRRDEASMRARAAALLQSLAARRTVREFSPEPIPLDVIDLAIRAAGTAPSGAHLQPWHFCVVTDPETKRAIREAAEAEEQANYAQRFPDEWLAALAPFGTDWRKPHLEEAPAVIVVLAERYRAIDGEKRKNYYVTESVGIALGLLIAALHEAGLATLTHTPNPMGRIRELVGRPEQETPLVLLPVGYPAADALVPVLARKPLDAIRTWIGPGPAPDVGVARPSGVLRIPGQTEEAS